MNPELPLPMSERVRTETIHVTGVVQGVGFRPNVFRLATDRSLRGSVCNDGVGVRIVVAGDAVRIDEFVMAIRAEAPTLARIDTITREVSDQPLDAGFSIRPSEHGRIRTESSADVATCAACLAEFNDPSNRRWKHPFINCTQCGPRLSIVRELPFDRARTSMASFAMCAECSREYGDPRDRRFHAQANACLVCGPRLRFEPRSDRDPLDSAWEVLSSGRILAIKGIGGYHLACAAQIDSAVSRLRARKRRPAKPFALLARDLAMVERYCSVSQEEAELLRSAAGPIVLLAARGRESVGPSVAPACTTLGFMLPYTALHHALMAVLDDPVVLTSGNLGEEPQCIDDGEALAKLAGVADAFLLHDRAIMNRVDDSVVRVAAGRARMVRRGRGYAPASLPLPPGFGRAPSVLAFGGELKNTVCVLRGGRATVSQHIGDLGNVRVEAALRSAVSLQERLFEQQPEVLAVDSHPTSRASRIGRARAEAEGLGLIEVQHHHAHIASCLAEHAIPLASPPVLGIALDGLGWGDDGTLWGGEFLQVDYRTSRRLASLRPVPMPGGEQAIHEPWRMAWSYLHTQTQMRELQRDATKLPFFQALRDRPVPTLLAMQRAGINSPLTSSCGRLFDAVSALIGVCQEASYEGQAAIELEARVDAEALVEGIGYPFGIGETEIHTAPLWTHLLDDLVAGIPTETIAARFHVGLVDAIVAMVERLTDVHADAWDHRVALGGGVFQNAIMLGRIETKLQAAGFIVLSPSLVPANDGGLSLGQAVVAAARWIGEA